MAQPTGSDMYVSRPLSNISVAYIQDNQEFIADKVFPPVPVSHRVGIYYKYDKGDWFRTQAQKRAPRTESAGTGWNVSQDTYAADVQAIHVDVDDQTRADQDRPVFDIDRDATLFVDRDLLLRREKDWADTYFKAGVWSNTVQTGIASGPGANQFIFWNRSTGSPIEVIEAQRLKFARLTGFRPNRLVLGPDVHSAFKNQSEFIERIKYTQKGVVSDELIASLLEIERVLTPYVVENSAEENAADDLDFVYGKSALLCYAAPNAGLRQPSAGYTFEWTGFLGSPSRGIRTKKFRMEELESDRVEGEMAYGMKVVSSDLGVFFENAVE